MKKIAYAILLTICALPAMSQGVNLNVYGAYVFDDSFDSYYDNNDYYNGKVLGGLQWGAGIEFSPRPEYGVELIYLRQDTEAPTEYIGGNFNTVRQTDFDLGINYVMIGGVRYMGIPDSKVEGYGGLMIGGMFASAHNPDNGNDSSVEKFAWGFRLGCNIWASERVGLKLQTQILSAVQSMGGGLYFGTGGGGVGVSSYSTIYQFTLGGGLVFKVK